MVICFLSGNKDFNADVIERAVFTFIVTPQTNRENMSMKFKRYLYLTLYFGRELIHLGPFPRRHHYLLLYIEFEEKI